MERIFNENWIKKAKNNPMIAGWLLEDSAITKLHVINNTDTVKTKPAVQQQIDDIVDKMESKTDEQPSEIKETVDNEIHEQATDVAEQLEATNVDTTVLNDTDVLKQDTPLTVEPVASGTVDDNVEFVDPNNNDDEKLDVEPPTNDGSSLNVELPDDTPEIEQPKHNKSLSISQPVSELIQHDIMEPQTQTVAESENVDIDNEPQQSVLYHQKFSCKSDFMFFVISSWYFWYLVQLCLIFA